MKKILYMLLTIFAISCSSGVVRPTKEYNKVVTDVVVENINIIKNNEKNIPVIVNALEKINKEQNNMEILQMLAELKLVVGNEESANHDFEKLSKYYKNQRDFLQNVYLPLALYKQERDKYIEDRIENIDIIVGEIYYELNYLDDAAIIFKKNLLLKKYNKNLLNKLYNIAFKQNDPYQMKALKNLYHNETGNKYDKPSKKVDSILKMPYMSFEDIKEMYTKEEFTNMGLKLVFEEGKEVIDSNKINILKNLFSYLNIKIENIRFNNEKEELDIIYYGILTNDKKRYTINLTKRVIEKLYNKDNIKVSIFTE